MTMLELCSECCNTLNEDGRFYVRNQFIRNRVGVLRKIKWDLNGTDYSRRKKLFLSTVFYVIFYV